jgi:colicin import membrane protein
VVTLRWRLKPDGSLDGEPQIEGAREDTQFRVAAAAALQAVKHCAPFPLPPDKYDYWKSITMKFDARRMM